MFPTQDWFNLPTYNISLLVSWLVNEVTGRRQRILSRVPVKSITSGFFTLHFNAAYPSRSRVCVSRFPLIRGSSIVTTHMNRVAVFFFTYCDTHMHRGVVLPLTVTSHMHHGVVLSIFAVALA